MKLSAILASISGMMAGLTISCPFSDIYIGGGKYYEETTVESLTFEPEDHLCLNNLVGSVYITGWDSAAVRIEATKKVRRQSEGEAKRILEKIKINVSKANNGVSIRTECPTNKVEASINYKISVPPRANLRIATEVGSIKIENINGNVDAKTDVGSIGYTADSFIEPIMISLKTEVGEIRLSIPDVPEPSIYARTEAGKIRSDFPIFTKKSGLKDGVRIILETSVGSISIEKR